LHFLLQDAAFLCSFDILPEVSHSLVQDAIFCDLTNAAAPQFPLPCSFDILPEVSHSLVSNYHRLRSNNAFGLNTSLHARRLLAAL
jgi:hypothetical protein